MTLKLKTKYSHYAPILNRINDRKDYRNDLANLVYAARDKDKDGIEVVYERLGLILRETVDGGYSEDENRRDRGLSGKISGLRSRKAGKYIPGFLIWLSIYHQQEAEQFFSSVKDPNSQKPFDFIEPPTIPGLDEIDARIEAERAPHRAEPPAYTGPELQLFTEEAALGPRRSANDYRFDRALIEFIGRENEFKEIERFLTTDRAFSWWQIAGASGQGKSRLALQIAKHYAEQHEWDTGFIERVDRNTVDAITNLQTARPVLMIIDNVGAPIRSMLLGQILKALEIQKDRLAHPVRLLVLERHPYRMPGIDGESSQGAEPVYAWYQYVLGDQSADAQFAIDSCFDAGGPVSLKDLNANTLQEISKAWAMRIEGRSLSNIELDAVEQTLGLSEVAVRPGDKKQKAPKYARKHLKSPLFAMLATEQVLRKADEAVPAAATFTEVLEGALDREAQDLFGLHNLDALAIAERETSVEEQNSAYLALMIGDVDSLQLERLGSAILAHSDAALPNAQRLLGSTVVHTDTSARPLLRSRAPDLLAEFQIIRAFEKHCQRYEAGLRRFQSREIERLYDLFRLGWTEDRLAMFNFLTRILEDFPESSFARCFLLFRSDGTGFNLAALSGALIVLYSWHVSLGDRLLDELVAENLSRQRYEASEVAQIQKKYMSGFAAVRSVPNLFGTLLRGLIVGSAEKSKFGLTGRLWLWLTRIFFPDLQDTGQADMTGKPLAGARRGLGFTGLDNSGIRYEERAPDAPLPGADLIDEELRQPNVQAYCFDLDWWQGATLVEVYVGNKSWPAGWFVCLAESRTCYEMRDAGAIHAINREVALNLNEQNVVDYLKFFCQLTRSNSDLFLVCDHWTSLPWLTEPNRSEADYLDQNIRPPRINGGGKNGWKVATYVLSAKMIIRATFSINTNGVVGMKSSSNIFCSTKLRGSYNGIEAAMVRFRQVIETFLKTALKRFL